MKVTSGRGISIALSMAAALTLTIAADIPRRRGDHRTHLRPDGCCTCILHRQVEQYVFACANTRTGIAGGAVQSCIQFVKKAPMKRSLVRPPATVSASSIDDEPVGSCEVSKDGEWTYSRRSGLCLTGAQGRYTLYDEKGKVLGTGLIDINTSLTLRQNTTEFKETISLKVTEVTDAVKSLNIGFAVQCTSTCTPTTRRPWYGNKTLLQEQSVSGEVAYNSRVASGAYDSFQTKYFMTVTANGATPVDPNMSWESPAELKIRCDEDMGGESTSRGCVVPIRETLEYSLSDPIHGAASAVYQYGQALRGNAPLSRGEGLSSTNRARTCESKIDPFVRRPDINAEDECDEFPFAGTYEGGTEGALCADVIPVLQNGKWVITQARANKPLTGQEPCVRANMSAEANGSAGGKLGSFFRNYRILDTEKFDMEFTP